MHHVLHEYFLHSNHWEEKTLSNKISTLNQACFVAIVTESYKNLHLLYKELYGLPEGKSIDKLVLKVHKTERENSFINAFIKTCPNFLEQRPLQDKAFKNLEKELLNDIVFEYNEFDDSVDNKRKLQEE